MRPDPQLAGLLGLTAAGGTLADAYLAVDTSAAPGAGIVAQTIQYHGTADRYTASGAADRRDALLGRGHEHRASRGHAAQRGRRRRPRGRVRLRPRALRRLHAPGQPGVRRHGARRLVAHPAERPLLPDVRRPRPRGHPAGRRAAAAARERHPRDAAGAAAAAAVLLPARRPQGRDRARARRPQHERGHARDLRQAERGQPGRLLGRGLAVPARDLVGLHRHRADRRPGRGLPGAGPRAGRARQHELPGLDARLAAGVLRGRPGGVPGDVPVGGAAAQQPDALHRLERLGDGGEGRSRAAASAST